ncbi:PLP-dependent transferase [Suhomyces tanzawaensis NRRL Y-17324]|uniref:Glutamate pyruvate transaminase n=1 Tax=Suhomyces tanzawaensis NRRL Y-17324 TaxID=984487 RepID=A0A1E4SIE7_9ASCO|nr:PLP-dependent transferase [Suhomyces tanzawaensis NRRL Y-17324]ODV79202.1 PLP-dependent transferase [Suhomyces tanzawaensis NRRL Y-17324]
MASSTLLWKRALPTTSRIVRMYSTFKPASPLTVHDINQHTIEAKYAVRGSIPIRADELQSLIDSHPTLHGLPFSKIINANIGNPQQLQQKPLTWYRQVLSILQYPELLDEVKFPADVVDRATTLLKHLGSVGAYSPSQGVPYIRNSVAQFISDRDGYDASPENIFLTGGASAAVTYLLQILSAGPNSGFLIPIPQYPLYTATIALNNAKPIGYFLNEDNHWSTDPNQIRQLIKTNKEQGVDIKALVVINPGNPTGSILSEQDIIELIDIAAEHGIVLISDEVYQENIFKGKFLSMKKVLCELKESHPHLYSNVQLASLHSTSKGVSGECGQRGGYMELIGFTQEVKSVVFKLASINLCSVVSGQALMELMINPPKPGQESYEQYHHETSAIHTDLETRASALYESFLEMEDISCNKPMGAMYLFPRLHFTEEHYPLLFKRARDQKQLPDDTYCIELLEHTGICCVPGNGFGQVEGTYHLRTTFLPPGTEWIEKWTAFHKAFIQKYKV